MRRAFLILAVATSASATLHAQAVSGRVTDRTSGFPVAGVVVQALDSSGATIARTVTDSASGYRIPILPGVVRLSFRRIGYSPAEAFLRDSVAGRIDVVLSRLPTQLAPVKAVIAAQCPARADAENALALWEQARSGMLTSMVARESRTAWISILSYNTSFNGDDEQPRSVSRLELASASNAFFPGAHPDSLAKLGYGTANLFGTMFLGPDDGVLFDDTFLATHCFGLGEATDTTISLDFEPAKGRKMIDIAGTVLFRRSPLELKSVVYRYTNVTPPIDRARPGGALLFERMPSGITMIQRWYIRGAFVVLESPRSGNRGGVAVPARGRGAATRAPRVSFGGRAEVQATETGALIELMQWPDAPAFVAPLATISGVLVDKHTKRPLTNTPVILYRTPYRTVTDSTGAFTLADVLPGVYEVDSGDPELEKYGAAAELIPVAIRHGPNTIDLAGEGPEAVVVRGCSEKMDNRVDMPRALGGNNAIFGQIVTNRRPPKQEEFRIEVLPAGAVPGTPAFPLKGKTDQAGRFRVCGLPHGTARIVLLDRNLSGVEEVALDPLHPYRLVTLKAAPPSRPYP